jgi:hypothetical protein
MGRHWHRINSSPLSQGILSRFRWLSPSLPSPDFVETSLTNASARPSPASAASVAALFVREGKTRCLTAVMTAPASASCQKIQNELFQFLKEQTHSLCLTNWLLLANLRSQFKASRSSLSFHPINEPLHRLWLCPMITSQVHLTKPK